jgi:hypothetical protein
VLNILTPPPDEEKPLARSISPAGTNGWWRRRLFLPHERPDQHHKRLTLRRVLTPEKVSELHARNGAAGRKVGLVHNIDHASPLIELKAPSVTVRAGEELS